jgi:hypothetical protein
MLAKEKNMASLESLLPALKNGTKIKLKHWGNNCFIGITADGKLYIQGEYTFQPKHILSDDWEISDSSLDKFTPGVVCYFWDEDESIGTYDKFGHVTYDFDDQIIYHPIGCSTLGYTNCRLLSDIEKGI